MKKSLIVACSLFWILPIFSPAWSQDITKDTLRKEKAVLEACKIIVNTCKSAGFYQGGAAKGKGLSENCVNPILSGQAVAGVTVNKADVVACQSLKAKMVNQ